MDLFFLVLKCILVLNVILTLASLCIWIERKASALIQDRVGANRAGAKFTTTRWYLKPLFFVLRLLGVFGVINTLFCDPVKALFKEDFIPKGANPLIHGLAPILAALPVFLAFSVIPMAPHFTIFDYEINPVLADMDGAILFFFAMGSLSVYGVSLAGWVSENKYSLLGGLRATAQMISYELAMTLILLSMVVLYGTMNFSQMIESQSSFLKWGIFSQPLGFIILFIVGMAETKRGPFDLPEAESELSAGYFTEYSGMKFLLFWLGEFAEIALFSMLLTVLFLGGWHFPGVDFSTQSPWMALLGHLIFIGKVVFFCVLQIVIRWTVPRFRYDQLMNLGWKILLPISIVNLVVTAIIVVLKSNT